ncbi:MAG TPA: ABC-2 family transporter protein [Haliangiales bacterium]|nr:ABC-2 family transporter protein [Haliangiales bacterium]
MRRYIYLVWIQLRASLAMAMQYRADFLVDGVISLWWMLWTLVPLAIVFGRQQAVAGWSFPEALVVAAWFTLLRGVIEGVVNPSLVAIADHIRMGTLDFVLVKPADAQFLVSTSKFAPWKVFDVVAAVAMAAIAFTRMGRAPAPIDIAASLVLLTAGVTILYSIWILAVSAAFWVVKLDNLAYLFSSIFDAARWPLDVFRGVWKILFTFVIPLGLMTTYPARALLGTLAPASAALAFGGALAFGALARFVWTRALANYTSASS